MATRTLIHDAGSLQFYRLISGSICVEKRAILPEDFDAHILDVAITHFRDCGLILGADGRAIGTPFAIEFTPDLFSVSFVPLAGWREEDCFDISLAWEATFSRTIDDTNTLSISVQRIGFRSYSQGIIDAPPVSR